MTDTKKAIAAFVCIYAIGFGILSIDGVVDWLNSPISKNHDHDAAERAAQYDCDYILNKNTGKFHYAWCESVEDMLDRNKVEFSGDREEVIEMGYVPCKWCDP